VRAGLKELVRSEDERPKLDAYVPPAASSSPLIVSYFGVYYRAMKQKVSKISSDIIDACIGDGQRRV
jgi:hypothetical protein